MWCLGLIVSFCFVEEPTVVQSYCEVAKPVYLSHQDTRGTKEQVDRENSKWKALCDGR